MLKLFQHHVIPILASRNGCTEGDARMLLVTKPPHSLVYYVHLGQGQAILQQALLPLRFSAHNAL
jgi:hypothetical protein